MIREKGQVSMEILIVLAIIIIIGVAFGAYYINNLNSSIEKEKHNKEINDTVDGFIDSMDDNEPMTVEIIISGSSPSYTCTTVPKFNQGQVTCKWNGVGTFGPCVLPSCLGSVDVNAKDEKGNYATAEITTP